MIQEFREFIARGNVMDMAVGIIMGAAFTGIVTSLVRDMINPLIALFTGGLDLSGLQIRLTGGEDGAVIAYGTFLMAVINFLIVAAVVFGLVKGVNRLKRAEAAEEAPAPQAPPPGPTETELLTEIRDALVARQGGA